MFKTIKEMVNAAMAVYKNKAECQKEKKIFSQSEVDKIKESNEKIVEQKNKELDEIKENSEKAVEQKDNELNEIKENSEKVIQQKCKELEALNEILDKTRIKHRKEDFNPLELINELADNSWTGVGPVRATVTSKDLKGVRVYFVSHTYERGYEEFAADCNVWASVDGKKIPLYAANSREIGEQCFKEEISGSYETVQLFFDKYFKDKEITLQRSTEYTFAKAKGFFHLDKIGEWGEFSYFNDGAGVPEAPFEVYVPCMSEC